jgi:hypothetical protein
MSIRERSLRRASNSGRGFAGLRLRMTVLRGISVVWIRRVLMPRRRLRVLMPRRHLRVLMPRRRLPRSHATQAPPRSHATQRLRVLCSRHLRVLMPRRHPPRSHATQAPDPAFERGSLTLLELSLESGEIVFDFGVAPIIFERRELRCRCGVPPFHFVGQLLHLFHRGNAAF